MDECLFKYIHTLKYILLTVIVHCSSAETPPITTGRGPREWSLTTVRTELRARNELEALNIAKKMSTSSSVWKREYMYTYMYIELGGKGCA